MSDTTSGIVIGVLSAVGVLLLLSTLAAVAFVVVLVKHRPPAKATFSGVGALLYSISPVDVVSEVALGPIGLLDDAGLVALAAWYIVRSIRTRNEREALAGSPHGAPATQPPTLDPRAW